MRLLVCSVDVRAERAAAGGGDTRLVEKEAGRRHLNSETTALHQRLQWDEDV
jgi:hypothetical protein